MPIFSYTFRDALGSVQKGTADSDSEELLRKRFEEQGFTITEVTMIKAKSPKTKSPGKVKLAEVFVSRLLNTGMLDWFASTKAWVSKPALILNSNTSAPLKIFRLL